MYPLSRSTRGTGGASARANLLRFIIIIIIIIILYYYSNFFVSSEQIHSRDGRGFGKGNLGPAGIRAFLAAHRCNPVCAALGCHGYNILLLLKL